MDSKAAKITLEQLYAQARAQFGDAIKGYWSYDPDPCPGCGREIDSLKVKGQKTLSINAFIYRARGILIGYFLCSRCVTQIMEAGQANPEVQLPLHTTIEKNLVKAYLKHLQ